ncbi:unnamed protein product [Darwinula stevensoni]|uniref:N-terminal kinase-like protein n=1 Tax=Darwinula stevensoni TaxID=69355 RepID=A0A7R8X1X5_9CRUS|nr:unnamed protein product [Darwinula stevensoni]CAG0883278.1 unnamed protein product [Darwinula stevensoni]
MWSFFSRDPLKDFPYELIDEEVNLEGQSLWRLHRGKKKGNGTQVSIFTYDVKGNGEVSLEMARGCIKRLKTIRHPSILPYLGDCETDKCIYLATEYVVPLSKYLSDLSLTGKKRELAISWGLYQVLMGLEFINGNCNMSHFNICPASVYVNVAGEWKLGGLEYMAQSGGQHIPTKILRSLDRYNPPEKNAATAWSTDAWGMGCLIWETFNHPFSNISELKNTGKIPKNLVPLYCELVGANPRSRPKAGKVLERGRCPGGFFSNPLVDTLLFLESITIKDNAEKTAFFAQLPPLLDSFPENLCKDKILPHLIHAFEFGNAGAPVISSMFKLGKLLGEAEYQEKMVPCIVKLFSSKDRTTRLRLLQQLESFVEHLNANVINKEIFPQLINGFMDTNPTIREHTVRSILFLASKLNYHNLNEEVLKHFARLQARDDQGGIRTNTTVCLGKIASYLHPQTRQKVLIPAFTRAMKDPFPSAKAAGLLALAATQSFYTMHDVALKILPSLMPLTMDENKPVRDEAFRTIKGFLAKLEKISEDPSLQESLEAEVNAQPSGNQGVDTSTWAGWAANALAFRFIKKPSPAKPGPGKDSENTEVSMEGNMKTMKSQEDTSNDRVKEEAEGWETEEGWVDFDDGDGELQQAEEKDRGEEREREKEMEKEKGKGKESEEVGGTDGVWEEWKAEDDPNVKPASAYNWPQSSTDDFFSPPQQASTKSSDGWDDADDWAPLETVPTEQEKRAEAERQAEERRLARQKQMEARRAARQSKPMKLGAKKLMDS